MSQILPSCLHAKTVSSPLRWGIGPLRTSLLFLAVGWAGSCSTALAVPPITVLFTDVSVESGLFDSDWPDNGPKGPFDPPGAQAVDVNGDGWVDIFVPLEADGVPDRLFINNADGTFTESASSWGIADTNVTHSALFFDYDNDGLLDLVLANNQQGTSDHVLRLFHHRPSEDFFDDVTAGSGMDFIWPTPGYPTGMAAADLDDDGFLDLIVGTFTGTSIGGTDVCLRNQGNGTFVDARAALGMPSGASNTWQAHFADLDLDGRIDLWLNEDTFFATRLYRNLAPWSVIEIGGQAGIGTGTDMGVTVADYDNDGDFDVFITDFTAGNCPYTGSGGVNRLYRNELVPSGALTFTDVADTIGVGQAGIGWGCTFFDYDNDSWQDLAMTSTTCNSRLFHNLAGVSFGSVGPSLGFDAVVKGGGVIALDYDRDGDRDLLLIVRNLPPMLFRNDGGNANRWLVVDPVFAIGNRQAIGAQVRVTIGGATLLRHISAGTSFKSQEPDEAHFGLGEATQADSVHILWPDNSWQEHTGVGADQFVTYTRVQGDFDWDGQVTPGSDVATFVSVLLGQSTGSNELLRADMNFDGMVNSLDIEPFVSAVLAGP